MPLNIQELRSALTFGGLRPANFTVQIFNPINASANLKQPFLVKASRIPASRVGVITVPYFGRQLPYAGDRQFTPWDVTVIQDEDHLIRNALEDWSSKINTHIGNLRTAGPLATDYMSSAQIISYSKQGVPLRVYTFHGLWPEEISDEQRDWGQSDTIAEFQCRFQYHFWTVSGGTTGFGGTQQ